MREHGEPLRSRIEALYREESRRVLATLIRLLGDFELAEEALHDAFIAAVEQWPRDGIPRNPRAWLVSAGRFKAIDNLRRRARFDASQRLLAEQLEEQAEAPAEEGDAVEDDRLRLIFTCCHPALTPEALRGKPRESLVATVLMGRPQTPMPPWAGLLSEDDAGWLVDRLIEGEIAP